MRTKVQKIISKNIPKEVWRVFHKFTAQGYEIYLVGAGVRNLLLGQIPVDCDFTTNVTPGIIQQLFKKSFYDNDFGTVAIPLETERGKEVYEITTYRTEWGYSDKRRPDEVRWGESLEEDLERRDFTMNAVVMGPVLKDGLWDGETLELIDLFGGIKDFKKKIVRAVGVPETRFSEDALRMMRAARFAVTLDFKIEKNTAKAIEMNSQLLGAISKERIRDELMKIIMSEGAAEGIELLRNLKLLKFIIPELEEGYGMEQNKHHIYEVYEHGILSLKYAAERNYNKYVRLAALLHDIGKPRVKEGKGPDATFYNHEVVGAKMTKDILERLKFSRKDIEKITKLVRYHLFYYTPEEVSESSIRRLLRKVGPEDIEDLLKVRYCDRIGSGCPKAEPYKLRHLRYLLDKISRDPISVKMLEASGNDIMEILKIEPGPKVGKILDILLSEVLDSPEKNKKDYLLNRISELGGLPEKELEELAKKAKAERENLVMKQDKMLKDKYWVT